jgi:hypothetical protein
LLYNATLRHAEHRTAQRSLLGLKKSCSARGSLKVSFGLLGSASRRGAGSRDDPLPGALICLTVLGTAPHCDEGFEKVVCARVVRKV